MSAVHPKQQLQAFDFFMMHDERLTTQAGLHAYKVYTCYTYYTFVLLHAYNQKSAILEYKRSHHLCPAWSIITVELYSTMYVLYSCLQMHKRSHYAIHLKAPQYRKKTMQVQ
jgi:hypothetical protein